jgi:hypothetical protein
MTKGTLTEMFEEQGSKFCYCSKSIPLHNVKLVVTAMITDWCCYGPGSLGLCRPLCSHVPPVSAVCICTF